MATREIPRDQWRTYLDKLSVGNRQRQVRVELMTPDVGEQVLTERAPLLAIEPELKGSDRCAIDVELGNQELADAFRITHEVRCATRLWVQEDETGTPQSLDIEGEEPATKAKIKTIVRFV